MIDMDIETDLFSMYKKYLLENSQYLSQDKQCVFLKAPQSLTIFPTIVVKEMNSIDASSYKTTNRQEYVNNLSYKIEIYTKNQNVDNKLISSKVIQNELKYLTLKFFNDVGFERTLCEPAEYLDVTVDRLIILEKCLINSWNKQLSI
jgi:hypothetical protein